jgi:hypothetical protein
MTALQANTATLHSDRLTLAGTLAVIHSCRAPTTAEAAGGRVLDELEVAHQDHEPGRSRPSAPR